SSTGKRARSRASALDRGTRGRSPRRPLRRRCSGRAARAWRFFRDTRPAEFRQAGRPASPESERFRLPRRRRPRHRRFGRDGCASFVFGADSIQLLVHDPCKRCHHARAARVGHGNSSVSGLSLSVALRPTPAAGAAGIPLEMVTVNKVGLKVVPRGAVTPMAPVTPLLGTTMLIWLSEITVKFMGVAAPVGKVTWLVPVKPMPLMVTLVPGGPDAGEVPVIATTGVSGFNCRR